MTGASAVATDLVTGAFGNSGSVLASMLRARQVQVRTLTDHPPEGWEHVGPQDGPGAPGSDPAPGDADERAQAGTPGHDGADAGDPGDGASDDEADGTDDEASDHADGTDDDLPRIEVRPHAFGDPDALAEAFDGVRTFYNTYWIRTGDETGYATAVARSKELVDAAARAGVERIVHLSVLHASATSPYPYFSAKAEVEAHGRACGVPFSVVRPALVFGGHSALIGNLAWMLRRLPVLGIAGDGAYRVRPVHVEDLAELCLAASEGEPTTVDAVGPDRPTYDELVTHLRAAVHGRARLVHLPLEAVLTGSRVLGRVLRDQVLTRDELVSTMDGLADVDGPATGQTSLVEWMYRHGATLGRSWTPATR